MRAGLLAFATVLVLCGTASPAPLELDAELRAAQQEIKLARNRLEAAGREYGAHRGEALVHLKRAVREIRLGLLDAAVEREHGPGYRHPLDGSAELR